MRRLLLLLAVGAVAWLSDNTPTERPAQVLRELDDRDLFYFNGDWESLLQPASKSKGKRVDEKDERTPGGENGAVQENADDEESLVATEEPLLPEEEQALKPEDWTNEDEEWINQTFYDEEGKELTRRQKILIRRAQKRAAREAKRAERLAAREAKQNSKEDDEEAENVADDVTLELGNAEELPGAPDQTIAVQQDAAVFQRLLSNSNSKPSAAVQRLLATLTSLQIGEQETATATNRRVLRADDEQRDAVFQRLLAEMQQPAIFQRLLSSVKESSVIQRVFNKLLAFQAEGEGISAAQRSLNADRRAVGTQITSSKGQLAGEQPAVATQLLLSSKQRPSVFQRMLRDVVFPTKGMQQVFRQVSEATPGAASHMLIPTNHVASIQQQVASSFRRLQEEAAQSAAVFQRLLAAAENGGAVPGYDVLLNDKATPVFDDIGQLLPDEPTGPAADEIRGHMFSDEATESKEENDDGRVDVPLKGEEQGVHNVGEMLPDDPQENNTVGGIVEENGDKTGGSIITDDKRSSGEGPSDNVPDSRKKESIGELLPEQTALPGSKPTSRPEVDAEQEETLRGFNGQGKGEILYDDEDRPGHDGKNDGDHLQELESTPIPTMVPGEEAPKHVRVIDNPCGFTLDIIFLRDMTSTMGTHLPFLGLEISGLLEQLHYSFPASQFGLASFRDKPISGIGEPDDYCVWADVPLGSFDDFGKDDHWTLDVGGGGGDWQDNQLGAVLRLARFTGFEPARLRGNRPVLQVVVVLTDSFPHLPPDTATAIEELNKQINNVTAERPDSGYRLWPSPLEFNFVFDNLLEEFMEEPNLSCLGVEYPSLDAFNENLHETGVVPLFLLLPTVTTTAEGETVAQVPFGMQDFVEGHEGFGSHVDVFLNQTTGLAAMYRELAGGLTAPLGVGRLAHHFEGLQEAVALFTARLAKDSCPSAEENDTGATDSGGSNSLGGMEGGNGDADGHVESGTPNRDNEENIRGTGWLGKSKEGWTTAQILWIGFGCCVVVVLAMTWYFGFHVWATIIHYVMPLASGPETAVRLADSGRDVVQPITPSKFA